MKGPLLLLAVSRPDLVGVKRGGKSGWREEEEVHRGIGGGGGGGAPISQLLVHKLHKPVRD